LCEKTFYIHQVTKKTTKAIQAIEAYEIQYEKEKNELIEILDSADGEAYSNAEINLEKLEESRDKKLWEIQKLFFEEKVLVCGPCTC
jgi:hypothetical protein